MVPLLFEEAVLVLATDLISPVFVSDVPENKAAELEGNWDEVAEYKEDCIHDFNFTYGGLIIWVVVPLAISTDVLPEIR